MSAFDRECLFSGERWVNASAYSQDLIQVHPRFLKRFRGAKAYLEIHTIFYLYQPLKDGSPHESPFVVLPEEKNTIDKDKNYRYVGYDYEYALVVSNENLQGDNQGYYHGWTRDLPKAKRKLKRLLRCRYLKVKWGS